MELLITEREHQIWSFLAEGGHIIQAHAQEISAARETPAVGDIYVGKVRNIVKNINAAFVEFAPGQMGYLSLAERAPIVFNTPGKSADTPGKSADAPGKSADTPGKSADMPCHAQNDARGRMQKSAQDVKKNKCPKKRTAPVRIGDEILVQIRREATGTKPPTLSGTIDLTGRYAVLVIGKSGCNISRKIRERSERQRLREILEERAGKGYLLMARTNSAGLAPEQLQQELTGLMQRRQRLIERGQHMTPFTKLEAALPAYLCDIRDGYAGEVEAIVTDVPSCYAQILAYLQENDPEECKKLRMWQPEEGRMDAVYNISRTLERAVQPRVWLKSGAYLVIQPTEALVSIDVNSGKAISKKRDVQQTFYRINVEAAEEIAVQLRLRNLSGMILVDFIDMEDPQMQADLMERFRQAVRKDSVPTTVVDMTKLGLVEVTRKKIRKSLYEISCGSNDRQRKGE